MIDTSALVAGLVADHEFHDRARPHLRGEVRIPAVVLAETYAQLRRTFRRSASEASMLLRPWTADETRVLATDTSAVRSVFDRAVELDLGGNIHDAIIAVVCKANSVDLVTLDRRQHVVALAFGVDSSLLLSSD